MTTLLDIFVGNETLIDFDVYQLWLDGFSVTTAAKLQQKKGCLLLYGATFEMLLSEVADQFRTFQIIEGYLKSPLQLTYQLEFQLTPEVQNMLIEKYYRIDSVVAREIVGKKLSTRLRGSLDEVSEKVGVSLKSCRRQFDNIKRVFKVTDDHPGKIVDNICQKFLVSQLLSRKYATAVFLSTNRFDLNKKKLGHVTFDQLVECSSLIMKYWTDADVLDQETNDTDLGKDFISDLKEFKAVIDKDVVEEHKEYFIQLMREKVSQEISEEFVSIYKCLSRSLLLSNITQGKELRELFVNLYDKIIEPTTQLPHSTPEYFKLCASCFQATLPSVPAINKSPKAASLIATWKRYSEVLNGCLMLLYPQN